MNDLETKIRERWGDREDRRRRRHSGGGHVLTGLFILLVGTAGLLKAMASPIPDWVFSWETFLIALGFFIGIRHQFRGVAWLVLIVIGCIFLMNDVYPDLSMKRYTWPLALIVVGIFLILRPHRRNWDSRQTDPNNLQTGSEESSWGQSKNYSSENFIDSTSIFGGIKKTILSKDFNGGDIVNIMGGTEINLTQADLNGIVTLEITQIFGGTKLIVPSHWEIKPEMVALFGGIEDKRSMQNVAANPGKVLVLKGTTIFGGIEIKNY